MPKPTSTQIKTEISTDPAAIGYAPSTTSGNDVDLATRLNSLTIGQSKGYTIEKTKVNASELQSAILAADYAALTVERRDLWQAILTAGQGLVDLKNTNIRSQIQGVWAAGTTSRTNIVALQSRACSRAETLWGENEIITASDVAMALRNVDGSPTA